MTIKLINSSLGHLRETKDLAANMIKSIRPAPFCRHKLERRG
jgi:hypothetical protein